MERRTLLEKIACLASGSVMLSSGRTKAADWPSAPSDSLKNGSNSPILSREVSETSYDVRQYGATGNGETDDATSIQKAIDLCSDNGGGRVLLHNGTFLSSGIALKDYVDLHLTSTATLLGSPDITKYNRDEKFNFSQPIRSLVYANGCQHISLSGAGKIDGQGKLFKADGSYTMRPQLVHLRGCQDVKIQDVLLTNSGMWAIWLLQCERVHLDSARIENLISPNRDGIDIDGCREVFISNCTIHSEDDSIAFKVSEKGHPCQDVVITNCLLSSRCAAFRFGPDAVDTIERISVSNCVIRNTGLNGIKIQETMGAAIRNITFSNIVMDNVVGPISIRLAGWKLDPSVQVWAEFDDSDWEQGKVENILFENIRATVPEDNFCMSITGTSKTRPQQITFSNLDFTFTGGGTASQSARREVPDLERDYPEIYIFGDLPAYALYIHHATGIVLNNVNFRLQKEDLRPAIVCDDVDDLELVGFKVEGSKNAESVIRLQNSKNVFIHDSRPTSEVGTFLRVEGAPSRDILLAGNRMNLATKIIETTPDVAQNAVRVDNNY